MTKVKIGLKLLIVLVIVMLGLVAGNTNAVKAITNDEAKEILNTLPDRIDLDIPEVEFEKAEELIEERYNELLNESDIAEKENFEISASPSQNAMFTYDFRIGLVIKGENSSCATKEIQVSYNNTNKGNSTDEQYVKNLKLENPQFFEMDLDVIAKNKDVWSWANKFITNYYTNIINDSSVKVVTFIGAGSGGGLAFGTCEGGIYLDIFKNGKFYDNKHIGNVDFISVINVPSIIKDNEFEEYVINEINKYYPNYASVITSVEKGVTDEDMVNVEIYRNMPDIYTIKVIESEAIGCLVFIKKTDNSLHIKDEATSIKMEADTTVLPSDTKLVVENLKEGTSYNTIEKALEKDTSKFIAYDITLTSNNVAIQPNGKVKISLPIPEIFDASKLVVYRVDELGNKTEYTVTVENGYATFETDHFSNYVLAEKTDTTSVEEEQNTVIEPDKEKTDHVLDNVPKTGVIDVKLIIGIILIVPVVGIVSNKRKNKKC